MKNHDFGCTNKGLHLNVYSLFIYEFMENHEFVYEFMKKTCIPRGAWAQILQILIYEFINEFIIYDSNFFEFWYEFTYELVH